MRVGHGLSRLVAVVAVVTKINHSLLLRLAFVGLGLLSITDTASAADSGRGCTNQLPIQISSCYVGKGSEQCESLLLADRKALPVRLALCDALVDGGYLDEAIELLKQGKIVHATDSVSLGVLERALSLVDERQQTVVLPPATSTLDEFTRIKCEEYKNASACRDILTKYPELHTPHMVLGNLASEAGDFTEASVHFLNARKNKAPASQVETPLANSLLARSRVLENCWSQATSSALATCRANLIPGFKDQSKIRLRIGDIQLINGDFQRAKRAYSEVASTESRLRATIVTQVESCLANDDNEALDACHRAMKNVAVIPDLYEIESRVHTQACLVAQQNMKREAYNVCSSALEIANQSDQETINSIMQHMEAPGNSPSDTPLDLAIKSCMQTTKSTGWATAPTVCREVASSPDSDKTKSKASQNAIRQELDNVRMQECEQAVSELTPPEARAECHKLIGTLYLPENVLLLNKTIDRLESVADSNGDVQFSVSGNAPLFVSEGEFVVTY